MLFLSRSNLEELYSSGLSMFEIAQKYKVSPHKVVYWMDKYKIKRRSRSEATYVKRNPNGDPFVFNKPKTLEEAKLYGIGLGLYWGEGTKASKTSVRIGNTNPALLKTFINFIVTIFSVKKDHLRFGLQIFTDINTKAALNYWTTQLGVKRSQFYKTIVTKSNSLGTYRKKSEYGVVTIYYHNSKLRNLLVTDLNSTF
ncbi:MAG: hypothetical protein US86_C0007G0081 [Candidatus Daviesbacteria bacterium GW2011_GWA2_38_24]|uniref:Uncharacterized protein n=1 Tax=Candidatus Daviesbacteria bacterium GW2011_GWA2_38_24 TaxID=1618422 RepID=A0A0G0MM88_9BACT|nr:MAG: hypothetical protein US86_C0007G0081 [Candidatus Daviesbacteria bacterium GW2011_GWA2_38_24]KKQ80308.1 MAG: hypothetical protein UT01_C0015G0011 [Candidatus Daviesbacteria bacterium GW2011_GWA1_38_7]